MSAITAIDSVRVGASGSTTLTFNNIPSTYDDLIVLIAARSSSEISASAKWAEIILQPNGSGSNLSTTNLAGSATTVISNTSAITAGYANGSSSTANTFSNTEIYISNYRGTTNKTWITNSVTEHNGNEAIRFTAANLWSQTTAISSISLTINQGNFVQHSFATLYGVTKGSSGGVTVT